MNSNILSYRFLIPVFISSTLLFLSFLFLLPIVDLDHSFANSLETPLLFGFLGCFLHEKIARCESSLIEKALRYGGFLNCLFLLPAFILTKGVTFHLIGEFSLGFLIFSLSFCPAIHLLYKWNPKGQGPYFSISKKFQDSK